jgi:hypothetical protein
VTQSELRSISVNRDSLGADDDQGPGTNRGSPAANTRSIDLLPN